MKAGNPLASELNITYVSHYGWNMKCPPPKKKPMHLTTWSNLVGFFWRSCWPFRRWGLISANRLAPYHWCLPSPSFLLSSTKRGEESESYSHHHKLHLAFSVTMKCILLNHELRRNPFSFKLLQLGVLSQQWEPYSLVECSGLPGIVWWSLWRGPYMRWDWRWRFNIWNVGWTYQEGVGPDLAVTASVVVFYPGGSKEGTKDGVRLGQSVVWDIRCSCQDKVLAERAHSTHNLGAIWATDKHSHAGEWGQRWRILGNKDRYLESDWQGKLNTLH